ncbi:hypothetical protein RJ640_022371 [Escallonia rubra]|uniref:Acyltransferase C-terminal domain-containing protein n=1 Tax=Escallonia rubra TaxID=112253 RepID=A0AA88U155_9ASTE|nr:hypothetical protein RJ640_022371 [Escallonia rubra]
MARRWGRSRWTTVVVSDVWLPQQFGSDGAQYCEAVQRNREGVTLRCNVGILDNKVPTVLLVVVLPGYHWMLTAIQLYTDLETYKALGKEHGIFMSNHIRSVDILILMYIAQVKVHIKRFAMKELREYDDGVAKWCKARFVAKVWTF